MTPSSAGRCTPRASQEKDLVCLLSGGAAVELVPQMKRPYRVIDNLVLEGLARFSQTL
jgi:type III pantothenate kinase